jgi:hypothetical protein
MLEESDTYLMILEQGEERGELRARRGDILIFGEEMLGGMANRCGRNSTRLPTMSG